MIILFTFLIHSLSHELIKTVSLNRYQSGSNLIFAYQDFGSLPQDDYSRLSISPTSRRYSLPYCSPGGSSSHKTPNSETVACIASNSASFLNRREWEACSISGSTSRRSDWLSTLPASVRRLRPGSRPTLRQRLLDPRHLQCLVRLQALLWLPFEAGLHELDQVGVVYFEGVSQRARRRVSHFASTIGDEDRVVVVVEEDAPPGGLGDEGARWHAHHLHYRCHLVVLVLAREDWDSY